MLSVLICYVFLTGLVTNNGGKIYSQEVKLTCSKASTEGCFPCLESDQSTGFTLRNKTVCFTSPSHSVGKFLTTLPANETKYLDIVVDNTGMESFL